jgi:predicted small secreted protein
MKYFKLLIVICIVCLLNGCGTIQGISQDLNWLSRQRMAFYEEGRMMIRDGNQDVLYYGHIGGKKALYKEVDGQLVMVESW